jgi:Fic-DOC domain mobile mystery protein B
MARTLGGNGEEGQTPIEDLSGLLPAIHFQHELDLHEFRNYVRAVTKYRLLAINGKTAPFTYEWLREVHRDMMSDVWQWAGEPRKSDKSIGVPKETIGSEIHKLLYELDTWEKDKEPAADIAVKLHHRLVWIHPFENGNGRWARLVTNIYLRKMKAKPLQWPEDPEYVKKTFRPLYLKAMKAADAGDFEPLAEIHKGYGGSR